MTFIRFDGIEATGLRITIFAAPVPELFARLTMEPFAEKPIDNLASTSLCTEPVRGEWRRVWGCVTQFNSIRHGRETAETITVEKLQKSPNR